MSAKLVLFSGIIACFCFSFGCKQKKRFQKKSLMKDCVFSLSSAIGFFAQSPLGLWRFAVAQSPQGLVALLSLKPRRLFISFARTKETKQRKFAVCTFLPTPALFSAKQKELATLKQLFVFYAPKSTSALRQKSEAGPSAFSQHRFARWVLVFSFFASLVFGHPERSVA